MTPTVARFSRRPRPLNDARYSTVSTHHSVREPDPLNVTDTPLLPLVLQDGSNVPFKRLHRLWMMERSYSPLHPTSR